MSKKDRTKSADAAPDMLSDTDIDLFRRQMTGTKIMRHRESVPVPRRVLPKARFSRQDEQQVLEESLTADIDDTEFHSGDNLSFRRPHIGRRVMRKLARGGYSVQAELDLHGMTIEQASGALREFIGDSRRRGFTCIRIIHGKGLGSGHRGPVLKGKVNNWLRRWDDVLAFVSARQMDGGTGAIHVLLQK
jgi:DNA-nicking Smr family endonuclease